jgi:CRP/FNR family cyclic AMP-dependent transcriptional regulator
LIERQQTSGPYGLPILESCLTCVLREERLFCNLQPEVLREWSAMRRTNYYPEGSILYVEAEAPRGLFILCAGKARLTCTGKQGKSVTLREVMPGEVMGLSCVVAGTPYQTMAQTLEPSEVGSVPGPEFLAFLRRHNEAALRVASHLSMELHRAWEQSRMLALAPNAKAKMAHLLLMWSDRQGQQTPEDMRFPMNMTQEAVGEAIGATRETVSRMLAGFQRQGLIRVSGSSVVLLDSDGLRGLTG